MRKRTCSRRKHRRPVRFGQGYQWKVYLKAAIMPRIRSKRGKTCTADASRPVPPAELAIMRRIDELHLDYPFAGCRMLRDMLRAEGVLIGRDLVATMMRRMGEAGQGSAAQPLEWQTRDRGAVSPAQYVQTCCWTQGLSVSAARPEDRPAEPGLGDGHGFLHRSGG